MRKTERKKKKLIRKLKYGSKHKVFLFSPTTLIVSKVTNNSKHLV